MVAIGFTITNLDTLDRALAQAPAGVETTTAAAVAASAPVLADAIADETPVRTGRLRASESVTPFEPMSLTAEVTELYASYVHDGTSRQAPNPYIDRGVEDAEPRAIAVIESHFDRWVSDFGG